ncbi:MAG: hypothetical protein NTV52_05455 [Acidobacteria bacterium]|nr:hypothetical protein [Acidobacteriota bacterium]
MSGGCAGIERGTKRGRLTLHLNMTIQSRFAEPKAVWLSLRTVTARWKVSGAWQVPS